MAISVPTLGVLLRFSYGESEWETHVRTVRNKSSPRPVKTTGLRGVRSVRELLHYIALPLFHRGELMLLSWMSVA